MSEPVVPLSRSGGFAIPAPAAEAFPLFGPLGERRWAEGWNPTILRPLPAADVEGVVFTTPASDGAEVLWLNLRFDAAAGVASYVNVWPGQRVSEITVEIAPDGERASRARVTYRWTPLSAAGAEAIAAQAARFDEWMEEWGRSVARALAAPSP